MLVGTLCKVRKKSLFSLSSQPEFELYHMAIVGEEQQNVSM